MIENKRVPVHREYFKESSALQIMTIVNEFKEIILLSHFYKVITEYIGLWQSETSFYFPAWL